MKIERRQSLNKRRSINEVKLENTLVGNFALANSIVWDVVFKLIC